MIQDILSKLKTGYETKNATIILQCLTQDIQSTISDELNLIFSYFDTISITMGTYKIVGNIPFAEIQHIRDYENIYTLSYYSARYGKSGSNSGDALFIFFQKINNDWKIYHLSRICNYHASLLCATR